MAASPKRGEPQVSPDQRSRPMRRQGIPCPLLGIAAAASLLLGCTFSGMAPFVSGVRGSGKVVQETRSVSGIDAVNLATLGDMNIELGEREAFRIEAEDNLIDMFQAEVRDGELRITTRPDMQPRPTVPVHFYLTAKNLHRISISSSGDIHAPELSSDRFAIMLSSSGDLQLDGLESEAVTVTLSSSGNAVLHKLNASSLQVYLSSAGDLTIGDGQVDQQEITLSSSGDYRAEHFESGSASVRLTSSGSATIWVEDSLQANLSSSGNLLYRGTPAVDASSTSSGSVLHIAD
jgi:hypothetical protein